MIKTVARHCFTESDNETYSLPKILATFLFSLFIYITLASYSKLLNNWLEYCGGWAVLIAGVYSLSRVSKEHISSMIDKTKSMIK